MVVLNIYFNFSASKPCPLHLNSVSPENIFSPMSLNGSTSLDNYLYSITSSKEYIGNISITPGKGYLLIPIAFYSASIFLHSLYLCVLRNCSTLSLHFVCEQCFINQIIISIVINSKKM